MTDPTPPRLNESLLQRLRASFGDEVDPGIALPEDEKGSAAREQAKSSGLVGRLKARVIASTRYRVEGEIGRGGMGAILEVWDEDLRRKLAMKVALGRGEQKEDGSTALDPRTVARFLEEAQVTGQLEHPGIVPVHELGLDKNGQVYFTMRLVRGRELARVFELVRDGQEGWSVTRALSVLLKVCEAMSYAHSKGVIHRDLKPSNVMVGQFGEVYVMDWGLVRVHGHEDQHDVRISPDRRNPGTTDVAAKAKDGPTVQPASSDSEQVEIGRREDASGSTRDELYTMDGDVIGTPAYMSPEQARGDLQKLDARSDVYAVGAMLYQLLAGVSPYDESKATGAIGILTALLKGPPQELVDLSDSPDELIAICDKAMAREPELRYPDMSALAEDLRAFMEHRVVQAYETGAVAEARKWVRRNRPLAASLAAGLLALIAGLVASLILKQRSDENATLAAERQIEAVQSAELAEERRVEAELSATLAEERRVAADASAAEAQQQTKIAREVNRFLNEDVFAAIAPEHMGIDVTMREVLDAASLQLAITPFLDPSVKAELFTTIGTSYQRLGVFEPALAHHEKALELRTATHGEASTLTLSSLRIVADLNSELGRYNEAARLLNRCIPLMEVELGPEHRGTLAAHNDLASILSSQGRLPEARAAFEELLAIEQRVLGEDHATTLSTLNNLALVYQEQGLLSEAEKTLRRVVKARRRTDGSRHPETLTAMSNLALTQADLGELDESTELLEEICEIREEQLGPEHPDTALGKNNLANNYLRVGRLLKAQRMLKGAVKVLRKTRGLDHVDTLASMNTLAVVYARRRKYDEALPLRLETLEAQRRVLGPEHPDTMISMSNLAVLYRSMDRLGEAESMQRETLDVQRRVLGEDHPSTLITLENLGGLLFYIEDYKGSLELTAQVLEARKRVLGPTHPDVAKTTYNLGMIAKSTGDTELALQYFEAALEATIAALGRNHLQTAECLTQLANLASKAKDYERSAKHYREALAIHRELGPDGPEVGYCLYQIGYGHYSSEQYPQAIEVLGEALLVRRQVLGDDDEPTLIAMFLLGRSHLRVDQYEECEPLLLEFNERQAKTQGRYIDKGRSLLVKLYEAWGKPELAKEWAEIEQENK